jgi:hypothetical protein
MRHVEIHPGFCRARPPHGNPTDALIVGVLIAAIVCGSMAALVLRAGGAS